MDLAFLSLDAKHHKKKQPGKGVAGGMAQETAIHLRIIRRLILRGNLLAPSGSVRRQADLRRVILLLACRSRAAFCKKSGRTKQAFDIWLARRFRPVAQRAGRLAGIARALPCRCRSCRARLRRHLVRPWIGGFADRGCGDGCRTAGCFRFFHAGFSSGFAADGDASARTRSARFFLPLIKFAGPDRPVFVRLFNRNSFGVPPCGGAPCGELKHEEF